MCWEEPGTALIPPVSGDYDAEIDDEVGVAVVLDDEEQESNEDEGLRSETTRREAKATGMLRRKMP